MSDNVAEVRSIIADFRRLERVYPSLRNDIVNVLVAFGGRRYALTLEDLKAAYMTMFGMSFPIKKDPIYIKICLMTIPGMAVTSDGLWYCYMHRV